MVITRRCRAWDEGYFPSTHTCDDPVTCALESMHEPDPRDAELKGLHDAMDLIEDLTDGRKTLRSEHVLKIIHDERGGPR